MSSINIFFESGIMLRNNLTNSDVILYKDYRDIGFSEAMLHAEHIINEDLNQKLVDSCTFSDDLYLSKSQIVEIKNKNLKLNNIIYKNLLKKISYSLLKKVSQ